METGTGEVEVPDDLAAAIGRVVIESALVDDVIRSVLQRLAASDITWVLFEGMSSEVLATNVLPLLNEADPQRRKWGEEGHRRVKDVLATWVELRSHRNFVAHGHWADRHIYDDAPARVRWHDPSDPGQTYFCRLSRRHYGIKEQSYSVADLLGLVELIRVLRAELAAALWPMVS